MSADTGVGPSMASGSQTCSGNWALLPIAPQKTRSATTTSGTVRVVVGSISLASDAWMFIVPVLTKIAMIPSAKPTSPTRLTMNAFLAARAAERLWYQNPMRL